MIIDGPGTTAERLLQLAEEFVPKKVAAIESGTNPEAVAQAVNATIAISKFYPSVKVRIKSPKRPRVDIKSGNKGIIKIFVDESMGYESAPTLENYTERAELGCSVHVHENTIGMVCTGSSLSELDKSRLGQYSGVISHLQYLLPEETSFARLAFDHEQPRARRFTAVFPYLQHEAVAKVNGTNLYPVLDSHKLISEKLWHSLRERLHAHAAGQWISLGFGILSGQTSEEKAYESLLEKDKDRLPEALETCYEIIRAVTERPEEMEFVGVRERFGVKEDCSGIFMSAVIGGLYGASRFNPKAVVDAYNKLTRYKKISAGDLESALEKNYNLNG